MDKLDLFIATSLGSIKERREFQLAYCEGGSLDRFHEKLKKKRSEVESIKEYCECSGVEIVLYDSQIYPSLLKQIPDAPLLLYAKGNVDLLKVSTAISMVGTRGATQYGTTMAFELAKELAGYGTVIVSGLADGIDAASHRGALSAGSTIAVIGSGLKFEYPAVNRDLYQQIYAEGLVLTEFAPDISPDRHTFPVRNRIIAGLSRGVVVVESKSSGGSMITAQLALDYDREVFAVPGRATDVTSRGTNKLIKLGAKLVESSSDITEELNWLIPKDAVKQEVKYKLSEEEQLVFDKMSLEPIYIDNLAEQVGLELKKVLTILTFLEMQSIVRQIPGKYYVKG